MLRLLYFSCGVYYNHPLVILQTKLKTEPLVWTLKFIYELILVENQTQWITQAI